MYLLLILQQLIASGTHVLAKSVTMELPPATVLLYRALIAAAIYSGYLFIKKKKLRPLDKADWWKFLLLGIINIPINQLLFLTGVKLSSPPNVALAYALTPAFVLIIATVFLREALNWKRTSGIFVAIIGTVLILAEKGFDFGSDSFLGDMMALTASFSWAIYTILGKTLSRKYGAIYMTGMAMIMGLLCYIPVYLLHPAEFVFSAITGVQWLQIFYLGAITSAVGYALWYFALTKIDASKVSVFNNIQPVFTTILTMIFFAYSPSYIFLIGGVLIISGVIITQKG